MTKAIRIHQNGGPEVLQWEDVDVPAPGPGHARIRQHAAGLNYLDVYHRSGLYKMPLPLIIGSEGAGVVEAIGPGVTAVKVGDRVGYAGQIGGYAEARLINAEQLVKLPDAVSFEQAAAMLLQGMTVEYLFRRTYKLKAGETILLHAAAGGVGLIACQWARALGVTVIGTVGSEEKAAIARAHGCTHTIVYTKENFVERVKQITNGQGVPVVYDSIGKDTWPASLDCLAPLGMMVSFGNASGPLPLINAADLASRGSLFFTRPSLMAYNAKREALVASANALFEVVTSGKVKIDINQRYALRDAARAHRDLEARKTTGSSIFTV